MFSRGSFQPDRLVFVLLIVIAFFLPTLQAEEEDAKRKRKLMESGTLSGTYRAGDQGIAIDGPWGREDTDIFNDDQAPITGSVSRILKRDWVLKVYNNSDDKYSITIRIVEYDTKRKQVNSFTRGYTLKAKENRQEKFISRFNTDTAELQLVSWKNLTPPKKKDEKEEEKDK